MGGGGGGGSEPSIPFSLKMRDVVVNVLCYIQQGSLGVITELTYYIFTSMYDCQHVSTRYTDLNLVTEVQLSWRFRLEAK